MDTTAIVVFSLLVLVVVVAIVFLIRENDRLDQLKPSDEAAPVTAASEPSTADLAGPGCLMALFEFLRGCTS
jgi:hypothetical protein